MQFQDGSRPKGRVRTVVALATLVAMAAAGLMSASTATAALPTPSDLRTFVGGKEIAVLWSVTTGATKYRLYRDGVAVATLAPTGTSPSRLDDGTRYYDSDVIGGQTYSYQVAAIDSSGVESSLSAPVSATHPVSSTPVPTITISAPSDLMPWLEKAGKQTIEIWYPKMAEVMARPEYTPPTTMSIFIKKDLGYVAYAMGGNIYMDEAWARAHPDAEPVFIHEAAHNLQSYTGSVPSMVVEGLPDWMRTFIFNDDGIAPPRVGSNYNDGYRTSAYLLHWISQKYNQPTFLRNLNVEAHFGRYSDSLFVQYFGKTIEELWNEMMATPSLPYYSGATFSSTAPPPVVTTTTTTAPDFGESTTGHLVNKASGTCLTVANGSTLSGTALQLSRCVATTAQDITFDRTVDNPSVGVLRVLGKCVDVKTSGTANRTPVQLWGCNSTNAQWWELQSDGTFKNPNSQKCLQPAGGKTADGTSMEIFNCSSKSTQKWQLKP